MNASLKTLLEMPNGEQRKLSWEEISSVCTTLDAGDEDRFWFWADFAKEIVRWYGKGATKELAKIRGVTAAYIREHIAASNQFPEEEDRVVAPPVKSSHFRAAATTENPNEWIEKAVAGNWTVKQLKKAIQDTKDGLDEFARYLRAREQVEQTVRKFNEDYEAAYGEEAVLEWKPARSKGEAA